MTPLCALSHVPCHDSVRAAYKKPAAISKMAGIMENSGLEDRSTPVISSLAIFLSLSLSFLWIWTNLFRSLSLCLSLLGDSFGGGEYFVKKKKEKGNIWTVLKRWEGRRKMLGGEGEGNRESGKWKVVRGYIQVWRVERENFVGSIKLWNSCVEILLQVVSQFFNSIRRNLWNYLNFFV